MMVHACNPQQEEVRRIMVQSQPQQILPDTLSQKRTGGVTQGIGPEFKSQYRKKQKQTKRL
jgi:hypothetical protein